MSASAVAITAFAVTLASVVVGQAVWRLAGAREWAWAGPATGLAALLVVCTVAVELPGAGIAGAVAIGALVLAAAPSARGLPWRELVLVAVLALLVGALPFIAWGHVGVLGVTDNGDLGGHIQLAESLRTGDEPVGLDPGWHRNYPTGSHALTASFATLAGDVEVDAAFMGLLMALVAIGALTALAALRDLSQPRRVAGALLVGAPYLVASYVVQASYKETLIGVLALGFALALPAVRSARSALPLVTIAAGTFVAYSFVGLEWPAVTGAAWLALFVVADRRLPSRAVLGRAVRPALALLALLALAVAPQLGRARDLVDAVINTAQGAGGAGGNVRAELPGYEVFGIWPNTDPRTLGDSPTLSRLLAAFGGAVTVWAAVWCWRRRRFELLALAGGCLLVYAQARALATPYYSGKALSIAAAPVMLVAATTW